MTSGDGTDDKPTDRPSPESIDSANEPDASEEPPAAKALPPAPTTVAPVSSNRWVMKDPSPPGASVRKTTFYFMSVRSFSTF